MHRRDILSRQQSEQDLPDLSLPFARSVANGLLEVPGVQQVEVFGLLATEGHGNNLCFLLLTDMDTYQEFVQKYDAITKELRSRRYSYPPEVIRWMVISSIWNIHNPEWVEIRTFFRSNVHTDICVVPVGWRDWWAVTWLPMVYDHDFIEMLFKEARSIATRRN